eukprot:TRINITY_DN86369_c0_g1_i2.p5 TRINITY_DN86369_c0_g1~~TRINITY_DN86369_c0_g1_i2.p5  ORF type:complete len:106 (-),score=4.37 TRINITY_DN86369_c0_g1_i2:275-592(-)
MWVLQNQILRNQVNKQLGIFLEICCNFYGQKKGKKYLLFMGKWDFWLGFGLNQKTNIEVIYCYIIVIILIQVEFFQSFKIGRNVDIKVQNLYNVYFSIYVCFTFW